MFNKLNPLIADGGAENDVSLKEDFKKSVRVEKFRIGEKAVYPRPSGSGTGAERRSWNWRRKRARRKRWNFWVTGRREGAQGSDPKVSP